LFYTSRREFRRATKTGPVADDNYILNVLT